MPLVHSSGVFVFWVPPVSASVFSLPRSSSLVALPGVPLSFCRVRFERVPLRSGGGYVLSGVPAESADRVAARLFARGCSVVSAPVRFIAVGGLRVCAFHFRCPSAFAAELAGLFPAPAGVAPLALSADGSRVLSGAAAARAPRFQLVAAPLPGPSSRVGGAM